MIENNWDLCYSASSSSLVSGLGEFHHAVFSFAIQQGLGFSICLAKSNEQKG